MDKFGPNNHRLNNGRRQTNTATLATGRNGCRCGNCANRNVNRIPLLSQVHTPFRIINIQPQTAQNNVPVTNPNVPNSNLRSRVRGGARTVCRVDTKVIRRSCNLCSRVTPRVTLPLLNNTTVYFRLSATEFSLRCYCICTCVSLIVILILLCIVNYVW
jgi:hypothetical protein